MWWRRRGGRWAERGGRRSVRVECERCGGKWGRRCGGEREVGGVRGIKQLEVVGRSGWKEWVVGRSGRRRRWRGGG